MNLHEKLILHDCPYCGCAGLLEEEQGWCWYVMCLGLPASLQTFGTSARLCAAASATERAYSIFPFSRD